MNFCGANLTSAHPALRILACFCAFLSLAASSSALDAPTWIWQNVGVPDGIPTSHRSTTATPDFLVTSYGANGSDTTDDRAALQKALDAAGAAATATSRKVVYLPNGTYYVSGDLYIPSNVIFLGQSRDGTILKSTGSGKGTLTFGNSGGAVAYTPTSYSVTITNDSNNVTGSTKINVSSATGIAAGDLVVITGLNDGSTVTNVTNNGTAAWVDGWGSSTGYTQGTRSRGQVVQVTAISGSTLTISPGLYTSYPTPWLTRFSKQGPRNSGVENLTVMSTNTEAMCNFRFDGAYGCWLYNVKSDYCDGDHVEIDWSLRCEVRKSYFYEGYIHSSGSYDTMLVLRLKSSACLVIDNIFERLHVSICTEWGAAGNVIAYNFTTNEYDLVETGTSGSRAVQMGINTNHGAHPQFNLFEGNVTNKMIADAFWGTSSDTWIFRNWIRGQSFSYSPYNTRYSAIGTPYELNQARVALDIWTGQTNYTAAANLLGVPSYKDKGYVRRIDSPTKYNYTTPTMIRTNYTATSDDGTKTSSNISSTTSFKDIYNGDFVSMPVYSDAELASVPNTLFLTNPNDELVSTGTVLSERLIIPAFGPADTSINPANPLTVYRIPAARRYTAMVKSLKRASGSYPLPPEQ